MFIRLAVESLKSRKGSVWLTVIAITISVFVLLAVDHIRHQAKESFGRTVSGVDLIVGPRSGQLNLLLSSVFRLGSTNNSMSWASYQKLHNHPMVTWAAPIALGDSHKGMPVIATTHSYFEHFKYGNKQALEFSEGKVFKRNNELVLGAEVAEKFGYNVGQNLVLSHGTGVTSFTHHDQMPFVIVGILNRTGTPVDQSLHISFAGMDLMHDSHSQESEHKHDHAHQTQVDYKVSAVFVGLKARYASLIMQKWANDNQEEALSAILPGVALTQLWRLLGSVETVLQSIAILVLFTTLIGLVTMLLASMREREREVAIMRVLGASPMFLFLLIELEVVLVTALSCLIALGSLGAGLELAAPYLASEFGLFIATNPLTANTGFVLGAVLLGSITVGFIPAFNAYRHSLQANLQNRR
jgi:putative ABC transport system permease protein